MKNSMRNTCMKKSIKNSMINFMKKFREKNSMKNFIKISIKTSMKNSMKNSMKKFREKNYVKDFIKISLKNSMKNFLFYILCTIYIYLRVVWTGTKNRIFNLKSVRKSFVSTVNHYRVKKNLNSEIEKLFLNNFC